MLAKVTINLFVIIIFFVATESWPRGRYSQRHDLVNQRLETPPISGGVQEIEEQLLPYEAEEEVLVEDKRDLTNYKSDVYPIHQDVMQDNTGYYPIPGDQVPRGYGGRQNRG